MKGGVIGRAGDEWCRRHGIQARYGARAARAGSTGTENKVRARTR